jgi:hypothetical protein
MFRKYKNLQNIGIQPCINKTEREHITCALVPSKRQQKAECSTSHDPEKRVCELTTAKFPFWVFDVRRPPCCMSF